MRISKVENQPYFKANFSNDEMTQYILREIRNSAKESCKNDLIDNSLNIVSLVRKKQTLKLTFTDDARLIVKPKNFLKDLFGKNEFFEQKIVKGDVVDAFVRLCSKILRGW